MPLDPQRIYYFGRLNLIATYTNKEDYLWLGFKPFVSIEDYDAKWSFVEREKLFFESNSYIHGYLVKYRNDSQETIRPEDGEFDEQEVINHIIAKTRFFIQVNSGIIAYCFTKGRISDKKFKQIFCKLFEESHNNFFIGAEIQAIEESYEIFEEIRSLDIVESVEFTLHPSNPFNRNMWKDTDDDIKDMNAATYIQKYIAKPDKSLNIDNIKHENKPNSILGKFQMALDGYGFGKIKGKSNGQDKIITTGKTPINEKILDDGDTNHIFEGLYKKFKYIKDNLMGGADK